MEKGYFITGTDTNVGKTWATLTLMHYFKNRGQSVVGMKPVASGCFKDQGKLKNLDALMIQESSSITVGYELVNPYAYVLPVSPHIAGKDNPVNLNNVLDSFNILKGLATVVIVEGVGGWYAPINDYQDVSDLAMSLQLPVILVVAMKLGCINHAKLTFQAIELSGMYCAGWIAMCTEPHFSYLNDNVNGLRHVIKAPLLGVLPYMKTVDFERLSKCVSIYSDT